MFSSHLLFISVSTWHVQLLWSDFLLIQQTFYQNVSSPIYYNSFMFLLIHLQVQIFVVRPSFVPNTIWLKHFISIYYLFFFLSTHCTGTIPVGRLSFNLTHIESLGRRTGNCFGNKWLKCLVCSQKILKIWCYLLSVFLPSILFWSDISRIKMFYCHLLFVGVSMNLFNG